MDVVGGSCVSGRETVCVVNACHALDLCEVCDEGGDRMNEWGTPKNHH